jgi:hypothetical protein
MGWPAPPLGVAFEPPQMDLGVARRLPLGPRVAMRHPRSTRGGFRAGPP